MTESDKERAERVGEERAGRVGDPKLQSAYRSLGAEEPPRALDDAILAAARRSARPWSQRWALPVSIAAVVVLSVTVTLRIQHERAGIEAPETAPQVAEPKAAAEAKPALAQQVPPSPRVEAPIQTGDNGALRDRQGVRVKKEAEAFPAAAPPAASIPAPAPETMRAEGPPGRADAARTAESNVAGVLARPAEERSSRDAASAARAPQAEPAQALARRADIAPTAKLAAEPPERELERIAELRKEQKHDEADKALAEFRKRHPDFKIPEAMRERVERR